MVNEPFRMDTQTEYLSPESAERMYENWVIASTKHNAEVKRRGEGYTIPINKRTFNDLLGEYYIQQGLKLGGAATPVADKNRYNRNLVGTDRLLEQSRAFSEPEMAGNLADLRYNDLIRGWRTGDPMVVGDAQMGYLDPEGLNKTELRPSLIKKANNAFYEPTFITDLQQAVRDEIKSRGDVGDTLDNAFVRMHKNNQLGYPTRFGTPHRGRFKDGKLMNNSQYTGSQNTDRQGRMDRIIFGLSPRRMRDGNQGYIPQELIQLNTGRTRNFIANELAKGNTSVIATGDINDELLDHNAVNANLLVEELLDNDAARPVIKDRAMMESI